MNKKRAVMFQHLRAANSPMGNPQRCFVLIAADGAIVNVIDEGYKGLPVECRGLTELYSVEISRSQYHEFLRVGKDKAELKGANHGAY